MKTFELISWGEEGTLERELHPDQASSFKTILGNVYSTGNVMRYLIKEGFKIGWLNYRITSANMVKINRSKFVNIPNYWELVKLIITDRMLSSRTLVDLIYEDTKDIGKYKFVVMVKVKKGILETIVPNDKIITYGSILGRIVGYLDKHRDLIPDGAVKAGKSNYVAFQTAVKDDVWLDIMSHRKAGVAIASKLQDISDEELEKYFKKIMHD